MCDCLRESVIISGNKIANQQVSKMNKFELETWKQNKTKNKKKIRLRKYESEKLLQMSPYNNFNVAKNLLP